MTNPNLELDVAILKKDITQIGHLFSKLELALDRVADSTNAVALVIAVSNQRLDVAASDLKRLDENVKELHSRITTSLRELRQEVMLEVENTSKELESFEERLTAIEKWRWLVVGATIAVSALFPQIQALFLN